MYDKINNFFKKHIALIIIIIVAVEIFELCCIFGLTLSKNHLKKDFEISMQDYEDYKEEIKKIITATPKPTPKPTPTPTPIPTPTPEPTQAPAQQYPDPEEYVINGASTSVKGMAEVKNAMTQYAKNNGIYLKTIETEIDGSLYLEIMCERSVAAATEINNQMLKAISGIDYDYIITITYLDIAKGENEANRVIMDADIYTNGSVKTYPRKGVQ